MHRLIAKELGKRFYRNWIFRNLSFELSEGERLLVTGPNGSGKSTLMRIISGQLAPTEGTLGFTLGKRRVEFEEFYKFLSWSGPYMDLYNELSLREVARLHFRFKKPLVELSEIPAVLELQGHEDKPLRHYSSGMLHRVKTGLCILSASKLLLLDEATTNMDQRNTDLIFKLLDQFLGNRTLIYASNNPAEFSRFENRLDLGVYSS